MPSKDSRSGLCTYEWIHLQMLIYKEQKQQSRTMRLQVTIFTIFNLNFQNRKDIKENEGERLLQTSCLHWKISWKKVSAEKVWGSSLISFWPKVFWIISVSHFTVNNHVKCRRFAAKKTTQCFSVLLNCNNKLIINNENVPLQLWKQRVQIKIPADPVPDESWLSGSQRLSVFLLCYHIMEGSKDIFMGIFYEGTNPIHEGTALVT